MAEKRTEILEEYEIEIEFTVRGCQYHTWNREMLLDEKCPSQFSFQREPTNPHDPNAIKVLFYNSACGYVAKEHIEGVNAFRDVYTQIRDKIGDFGTSSEVLTIHMNSKDVITHIDVVVWATAMVTKELADRLDGLA